MKALPSRNDDATPCHSSSITQSTAVSTALLGFNVDNGLALSQVNVDTMRSATLTAAVEPTGLGCTPNDSTLPDLEQTHVSGDFKHPPDEAINTAVRAFQRKLANWEFKDNAKKLEFGILISTFYGWADELWQRFVPRQWDKKPVIQPKVLLMFQWESSRRLGHYCPNRNDTGFRWGVSLNPRNLLRLSDIEIAGVILHELLHCFEDLVGKIGRSRNNYHSAWLRKKADQLGIPCTKFGCTCGIREDSPFMEWARETGLKGIPVLNLSLLNEESSSTAKRKPWICGCPLGQAITVYVPQGSRLRAQCEVCEKLFHPKELHKIPRLAIDQTAANRQPLIFPPSSANAPVKESPQAVNIEENANGIRSTSVE